MIQPKLINCPNCREKNRNEALGSITSEGYFIMKRKFGMMTLILSESYSVICDCGYYIRIHNGEITQEALANVVHG